MLATASAQVCVPLRHSSLYLDIDASWVQYIISTQVYVVVFNALVDSSQGIGRIAFYC